MLHSIPIFPLHAHILPGGLLSLRIFEQRYLRMVKAVCREASGFGIAMMQDFSDKPGKQSVLPIGTYVKIVDFDALPNNILGIKVQGKSKFRLHSTTMELDGLMMGEVEFMKNWAPTPFYHYQTILCGKLKEIFKAYPNIDNLYQHKSFDDATWVSQRLIELLPFESELKQELIADPDCRQTVDFLMQRCEFGITE